MPQLSPHTSRHSAKPLLFARLLATAWAALSVLGCATAMASNGGVVGSGVVVSGPNAGSSTRATVGDEIGWSFAYDHGPLSRPSFSSTISVSPGQAFVPGSLQLPAGLRAEYSTDGTSFSGTDSSATGVVRVTGTLPEAAAGVSVPIAATTGAAAYTSAAGGDGYLPVVISDRVFNVWHHLSSSSRPPKLECHAIATGSACSGYPYVLSFGGSPVATSHSPIVVADEAAGRLWVPARRQDAGHVTDVGYLCVSVGSLGSAPASCGWVSTGALPNALAVGADAPAGGGLVAGRVYALTADGNVQCLDPLANGGSGGACPGYPVDTGLRDAAPGSYAIAFTPIPGSTRLIARMTHYPTSGRPLPTGAGVDIVCFDAATAGPCPGWGGSAARTLTPPNPSPTGSPYAVGGDVLPIQTAGSTWDAFCASMNDDGDSSVHVATATLRCLSLADGSVVAEPPGLATLPTSNWNWGYGAGPYGRGATFGHRLYYPLMDIENWDKDAIGCYDFAAARACDGYPYHDPVTLAPYGVAVDSTGTCLFAYGDLGRYAVGTTADPAQPCASAGTTNSTTAVAVQPTRAYCGSDRSGATWGAATLRNVSSGSDYASGTITIRDMNGNVVTGFNAAAIPANGIVDLSSIPKSGATAELSVAVALTGVTNLAKFGTGAARLDVTWAGSAPTAACFHTRVQPSCAASVTTSAATTFTDAVLGAQATITTANASFDAGAAPAACASTSTLTSTGIGTATQSATVAIPPGGSAALLDASGNPATVVTVAGEGTYALNIFTGTITFVPAAGFHGTATGIRYRVYGAFDSAADSTYTPTVTLPPPPAATPLSSTGGAGATQQQTITIPPGGTARLLDANRQRATTVVIPGEGTYTISVGAASGIATITFTPAPSFSGQASGVTYQVVDAYGQAATAAYRPNVTTAPNPPRRTLHPGVRAPARVVLTRAHGTVPITCALRGARMTRCQITLLARISGRSVVVGRSITHARHVNIRLTSLGRVLARQLGGVRLRVLAAIRVGGRADTLATHTATVVLAGSFMLPRPVYFDTGSATLRLSARRYLTTLRARLAGVRAITCAGFTDNRNSNAYNLTLGTRRAAAVCRYLAYRTGIRTATATDGETRPAASNATPQGQQRNRRVETHITY